MGWPIVKFTFLLFQHLQNTALSVISSTSIVSTILGLESWMTLLHLPVQEARFAFGQNAR